MALFEVFLRKKSKSQISQASSGHNPGFCYTKWQISVKKVQKLKKVVFFLP